MPDASKGVLLVVDDEPLKRLSLKIELAEAGYTVVDAADGPTALQVLQSRPVDAVITDLRMPEMDGFGLLERIQRHWPRTSVVVMTAYGSIDTAIEAVRRGAADYLAKPFDTAELIARLERLRAASAWSSQEDSRAAVEEMGPLAGRSPAMRRLFDQIRQAAGSDRPVLLECEKGAAPERVAAALHMSGPRHEGPFVRSTCTSVSAAALDAELFGTAGREGRFQEAAGGTLFLDDIDAAPPEMQARLLSVLESAAADPRSGPRLVCATQKDLQQLMDAGRFRVDLFYRISATTILIPALRDCREDIPLLAERFLRSQSVAGGNGRRPLRISPHAMQELQAYDWPGNILELEHTLERAVSLAGDAEVIELKDVALPRKCRSMPEDAARLPQCPAGLTETVAGVERALIDAALRRAAGNQAKAAEYLGIPRTTLRDKMVKHGFAKDPAGRDRASA